MPPLRSYAVPRTYAVGLTLAVALVLTACDSPDAASPGERGPSSAATASGSSAEGPPRDASTDEFCAAVAQAPDRPAAATAEAWAAVGTPPDIPGEARTGFEAFIAGRGVPGNAEERKSLVALARYVVDTCGAFPAGRG